MGKRVYLSPSSQTENVYALGGTNEADQCRRIAQALKKELERCGFWAYAGMDGTMYTRAAESDKFGVDLHLPIHTNAHNGQVAGLRIFVYALGGEAERIARAIDKYLAPVTPGDSDGISAQPQLYEIKATDAVCVYLEVGFHDNPEEARWIIDNTAKIAEMIARGLCEYYAVAYVPENQEGGQVSKYFKDVSDQAWYAGAVDYCKENGLMQGDGDDRFRPDDPITRAEVAAVMERLHKTLNK